MGREFYSATPYEKAGLAFDPFRLHEHLERYIADDSHCVYVAEVDGEVIGMAGALVWQSYISSGLMATELFWWVEPRARGGMAAMRLYRALKAWAQDKGAAALIMVSVATIDDSPADAIYERLGMRLAERVWIQEV